MINDEAIQEYIDAIQGTFNSYCKKPSWEKMQTILKHTLLLGMELGRKEVYMNRSVQRRSNGRKRKSKNNRG